MPTEDESGLEDEEEDEEHYSDHGFPTDFDFFSLLSKPKDYYKILEVDYDASEDIIRSNYIRLALKWHPDKRKDEDCATSRFQDINEAYKVLSDPVRRREYDKKGVLYIQDYNVTEYLNRYKGLILTCNGLGVRYSIWRFLIVKGAVLGPVRARFQNTPLTISHQLGSISSRSA